MGIKERQERDREAVRRAILDAARELFVKEGFANVSIRKIAERIEYSPAAIYGYFPSKDDIFWALAEEGFQLLYGSAEDRAPLEGLPPLEHVRASFRRLYAFSTEHPQYFSLMFIDHSVPRISRGYEGFACAQEMKNEMRALLRAAADAGMLPAHVSPDVLFRLLSAALVGVAVLRLSGRLAPGEDAEALASDVLDLTMAGLQAGVPLRSSLAPHPLDPESHGCAAHVHNRSRS